ncbi:hypothetical protein COCVIDRAFT_42862 [Bipolaris victoriae FI3]|uniref:BZIP domain-containing protein n=1 Tax=Bipolaris victoriae (strain FI3) TaxID=930091 RepID=W7EAK5_BIPV3|nr:hypothetical protein COCVIDRAFT_42862 [Bipolaris victoriae FI3]
MEEHSLDSSLFSHTINISAIIATPLRSIVTHITSHARHIGYGQVLPEPKAILPPRKRAKTEDEKEQRCIERIKGKRQEYEVLQNEKDELKAISMFTSDFLTLPNHFFDTICSAQIPISFPAPESMEPPTPEFDPTQYSAAVLCDMQFNEKLIMESFFDFDRFPKYCSTSTSPEPAFNIINLSSVDVLGSALFECSSHSNPWGFHDNFDAKFYDLQNASGATSVSDEAFAAEQL